MKYHREKLALKGLSPLAVGAAALLMILSIPGLAQRGGTSGPSPGANRARERGVIEHERQMRVMLNSKEAEQPSNEAQLQAIIEQTRQDFDRIQVVTREMMRAVGTRDRFDYKSIMDMTAEIRKRARRLKDNTNLPKPDDHQAVQRKQGEIGEEEMKEALLALKDRVTSFVMNPLFQSSNLIDVKLGVAASRDLETIIELSGQIRKSAEKLSKTSAP
ncbi:MAG TPA: hypothetical protein VGX92_01735 [Pyrinomonadaceae bacterium]|jgi:Spy/CpxP family protein refolding chaperone|nr:hypothetical protein [Pyrinomonadaceae bacterium]